MLNKLKMILNNGSLMKRIGFTALILFVFQVLTVIPIPLVNVGTMEDYLTDGGFLNFLSTFSGGALKNFSVIALGISPYITASIVIQLLQMDIIPIFKEWSEQGEAGKQKLNQVTRYSALGLAFINALVLLLGIATSSGGNLDVLLKVELIGVLPTPMAYLFMAIVMTAGSAFVMWIADLITRKGVGNGTSMIIVAGIITSMIQMFVDLNTTYPLDGGVTNILFYVGIIVLYFVVLLGVVYMQLAVRKIPIQYANRQGKSDSNIPMKLNSSGVIPVIFAATLLSIPVQITSLFNLDANATSIINSIFSYNEPIGFVIYVLLIFVFTFFYAFLMVNPEKMADNLSKQNAYIPGIKPGEDTHSFLARLLFKITIIGSTALVVLSIIPIVTSWIFNLGNTAITIGGTSLLIVVGVALETVRQVETDAEDKSYAGFIR